MATRRHADTEAPLEGFEARIQSAFEWVGEHPREFLSAVGGLLLVGALVAIIYEVRVSQRDSAATALARIEDRFAESMGGTRAISLVPEPANPEQAQRSREAALVALDAYVEEYAGARPADFARLRAAEMEADLGRFPESEARLTALADDLDEDDPFRGVTLRFLGYVLEEQQRPAEAGEAYAAAAEIESYPDAAAVWVAAGEAFRRAGERSRAQFAYAQALSADPAYAVSQQIEDLLTLLEATSEPSEEASPESPPGP
jgi:tetratricopeptide (TPR) repeat protein